MDINKIIRQTINEVVKRGDYDSEKAYQYDRVADIGNAKYEIANIIEKYELDINEIKQVFYTMIKYFGNKQ